MIRASSSQLCRPHFKLCFWWKSQKYGISTKVRASIKRHFYTFLQQSLQLRTCYIFKTSMSFPCLIKQQSFQYAPRALKGPVMEAQSSPGDHKMKSAQKVHDCLLVTTRLWSVLGCFGPLQYSRGKSPLPYNPLYEEYLQSLKIPTYSFGRIFKISIIF